MASKGRSLINVNGIIDVPRILRLPPAIRKRGSF
jgi:hypothetical protein